MNRLAKLLTLAMVAVLSVAMAQTKVSVAFDPNWRNALEPLINEFNTQNKDVQIDPLWGGDQTKLIAAQKAPDILGIGDPHIRTLSDILLDLNPYIAKEPGMISDFYPKMVSMFKVNGKQLMLPFRFNVSLLYYNKDLFDAAKVGYPKANWAQADFLNAAQKLTKTDGGKVTQWGAASVFGWWGEWLIHVRQAGGDFMRGDKVILDSPAAVAGLQIFLEKTTLGKYKVSPGPKDDSMGGFAGGKTAMEYGGHTGTWPGLNQAKSLNWDIQVLPRGLARQTGAELAVEGYGIYSGTKNPEAAWQVLKFITGEKFIAASFNKLTLPPARQSVAKAALAVPKAQRNNPKNLEALFTALYTGMTLPNNREFINTAIQVVQPEIDKMLEGRQSPADTAHIATEKANKYLQSTR